MHRDSIEISSLLTIYPLFKRDGNQTKMLCAIKAMAPDFINPRVVSNRYSYSDSDFFAHDYF